MPVINHICGNCSKRLGSETQPQLGIHMGEDSRVVTDPDCVSCNPYYNSICKKCGANRINKGGICVKCNTTFPKNVPKEKK